MPPARIGKLKIEKYPDSSELVAEWIAPGGNYDSGFVSGYNFVYSDSISKMLSIINSKNPSHLNVLHRLQRRDNAGSSVSHTFTFQKYDKLYFVGLYAYDQAGNLGKLSN